MDRARIPKKIKVTIGNLKEMIYNNCRGRIERKYTLEVHCKLAEKSNKILDDQIGQQIKIVGTVSEVNVKTKNKVSNIKIKECYIK